MVQKSAASATQSAPASFGSRRTLRWLVPLGAVGVVALLASGALSADAKGNLPAQSAAQLLAEVGNSKVAGFSGTVVEKASLGLPELPDLGGNSAGTGPLGLLTGSHTARVWYAGETKQRIALLDSLGEQDVFRDGRQLWQWNSDTRTATHSMLPDAAAASVTPAPVLTPDVAARRALDLIGPSTLVSTDRAGTVAGRAAYVLVLTPKDALSRVGSVRISVDGKTKVPLAVQVYPRSSQKAAIDISFTRFSDSVPSNDNFDWTPPAGVTVTQPTPPRHPSGYQPPVSKAPVVKVPAMSRIGEGWTTVAQLKNVPSLAQLGKQSKEASTVLGSLPQVHGAWGSGRLFSSKLITALFTTDGRVFVGAVDPELLYQAAAR